MNVHPHVKLVDITASTLSLSQTHSLSLDTRTGNPPFRDMDIAQYA